MGEGTVGLHLFLLACLILFAFVTFSEVPVFVWGWVKLFLSRLVLLNLSLMMGDFPNGSNDDPKPLSRGSLSLDQIYPLFEYLMTGSNLQRHVWRRRLVIPSLCHCNT